MASSLTSRFDLTNLNRLLRKESLEKSTTVLKVVLMVGGCVLLGYTISEVANSLLAIRGASAKLAGKAEELKIAREAIRKPEAKRLSDFQMVASKPLFGVIGEAQLAATAAPVKPITKIPLSLIGTFISDGQDPYAIVEDKRKSTQDVFNINDRLFGEATLKTIFRDRVEIERNGQIEILAIDDSPGAADSSSSSSASQDEFVVDEAELDRNLENLPLLLTQARAVPYFKEGKSVGLRMFAIKSGSMFEKIGLKNGDILKGINGNSMGDLSQAMKLFEQLKQERSITVVLERDRQDKEFKYQIR